MAAMALLSHAGSVWAATNAGNGNCGTIYGHGQYGPYDYRTATRFQVDIVVDAHFTNEIENLIRGLNGTLGGELDYTLRALPNYPRALVAMTRLSERLGTDQPDGARFTLRCYFERAMRFRPDDNIVRMLYADYLINRKRLDEAVAQLDYVGSTLDQENAIGHYNLSLLYLNAAKYDKARDAAVRAQALGKSIEPIRERLVAAGQTVPPNPEPPADAASAPASAAEPASATASK